MNEEFIHVRWGLTSRQLNITGWTKGEWIDCVNGEKKRVLENPGHNKYWDFLGLDGKHTLEKYFEKENNKEDEEEKIPPERTLYDFVQTLEMEFCCDQFANDCVVYNKKYYQLNSREIKAIISSMYFKEKGCVFSNQTWEKVINVLSNDCTLNPKSFPIRCYTEADNVYYDSGDCVWKFYGGKATRYELNDSECPVIFRRYPHQINAPIKETSKTAKELLEQVTELFNIQDFRAETIPPLFCSEHPNPMFLVTGDPGAAKSTFTLFLKMLVDPDQVDKLSMPDKKNLVEFGLHRQRFYLLLYDNIRSFYQEQSDELCRMITGGTSITRKLYTNGELYVTKGLPRIIGNGLRPEPSSFNDLLDRTLLFDMNRIKHSKPEKFIWRILNDLIPEIRYACLRDASEALTLAYEQEFPKMPRMSEFCLISESLNVLWKGELGSFVNWFNNKMDIAHASGMDDPLTVVLLKYFEIYKSDTEYGIARTTSEWKYTLEQWAMQKDGSYNFIYPEAAMCVQEKDYPKNAVWLGRRFRDLSPLLNGLGYEVSVIRTSQENKVMFKKKTILVDSMSSI